MQSHGVGRMLVLACLLMVDVVPPGRANMGALVVSRTVGPEALALIEALDQGVSAGLLAEVRRQVLVSPGSAVLLTAEAVTLAPWLAVDLVEVVLSAMPPGYRPLAALTLVSIVLLASKGRQSERVLATALRLSPELKGARVQAVVSTVLHSLNAQGQAGFLAVEVPLLARRDPEAAQAISDAADVLTRVRADLLRLQRDRTEAVLRLSPNPGKAGQVELRGNAGAPLADPMPRVPSTSLPSPS